jgi:hypothetical protein
LVVSWNDDAGAEDGGDRLVGRVGGGELLLGEGEHPRHVDRDVPVADDDGPGGGEVERDSLEVGVAVVPGDERGRGPRAGQVLTRDPHAPIGLGAEGVDDGVVALRQVVVPEIAADLDVAEEAKAGPLGDLLEGT